METEKVNLVFLPSPGMGHVISTVEMAQLLCFRSPRISITVFTMRHHRKPSLTSLTSSYISSITSPNITFIDLPYPSDFHVDPTQNGETIISLYIQSHIPLIKQSIQNLNRPISAIIMDLFSTTLIDLADDFGVPAYVFFTSCASFLGLMLHLPSFHGTDFMDMKKDGLAVPTLPVKLDPLALPSPMLDKTNDAYEWYMYHGRRFKDLRGVIVNSFVEVESHASNSLSAARAPPVFMVGPIIDVHPRRQERRHECMEWLDGQPKNSVVFLCFGSMGAVSAEQAKEIARALEGCGYGFLWAVRVHDKVERFGLSLEADADAEMESLFPEGFVERTGKRGMVLKGWVPQKEILAHPATGGFMTHCGWNSILEGVWFGVPMLAWPMYAEQRFNAVLVTEVVGVAVGMELDYGGNGGVVKAEEVERGIRYLMEDGRVRERVGEMSGVSRRVGVDGGSSFAEVGRLVEEIMGERMNGKAS
ncbi:putative UDP-glucose flavonoid 3-O-glucosyltransferase 3 [Acorus gramineus]|uniref:Glycosyltransferase n=1 Tax=Acorus gramineus TaxID=55184 RepID=A0AAV9BTC7_ACOGR|nr:putative UDP-glucose flavonoid 3-O-glucosyltransferase 3 [Acorus gramineus]